MRRGHPTGAGSSQDRKPRPDLRVLGRAQIVGRRRRQDRPRLVPGPGPGVAPTGLFPGRGRLAIGDFGIEIIPLHRRERMGPAQEMPLAQHRIAHRVKAQIGRIHLDPA